MHSSLNFTIQFRFDPEYVKKSPQHHVLHDVFLLCSSEDANIKRSIGRFITRHFTENVSLSQLVSASHLVSASLKSVTVDHSNICPIIMTIDCGEQSNGKLATPRLTHCFLSLTDNG